MRRLVERSAGEGIDHGGAGTAGGWPGRRSRTETLWRKARGAAPPTPGAEASVDRAFDEQGGAPLPDAIRGKFEASLGADLGHVRVHAGDASGEAANAVGARAFTVGPDIHFAPGEYAPSSPDGERLLAHEVAHTAQQAGAAPSIQGYGGAVSGPGDAEEAQADAAAGAMVQGAPVAAAGASASSGGAAEVLRAAVAAGLPALKAALATLGAEVIASLIPTMPDVLEAILDWFWPPGTGTSLEIAVAGELYVAGSDVGIPCDVTATGEGGIKVSMIRVGLNVELDVEAKAEAEGAAGATIKAVELFGGVTLAGLLGFGSTTDLGALTWPAGAVTQLFSGDFKGFLRTLAGTGKSFWSATQLEAKAEGKGAVFGELTAGLDSVLDGVARAGTEAGLEVTAATRSTSADGQVELRGGVEQFMRLAVEVGGEIPWLADSIVSNARANKNEIEGALGIGMRAKYIFPKLSEPERPNTWEVAIFGTGEVEGAILGQGLSGKLEGEIVLQQADIAAFIEMLETGKVTPAAIPISSLGCKIEGKLSLQQIDFLTPILRKLGIDPESDRGEWGFTLEVSASKDIVTRWIERAGAQASAISTAILAGDARGALRAAILALGDNVAETLADLVSLFQKLTLEASYTDDAGGELATPGMGDISGIGGGAVVSVASLRKIELGPSDVYLDKIAELLRGII